MAVITSPKRPSTASRRAGYVVSAVINTAVLYVIFAEPGWRALPILTDDTTRVLGLVALSGVVGICCNVLYLAADPRWLVALGGIATTGVGLVVLWRIWSVFPFDFGAWSGAWPLVARTLLLVAIIGSVIGVLVQVVTLVRAIGRACASGAERADDRSAWSHR